MKSNPKLGPDALFSPLESFFEDSAEYFGIARVPEVFAETLERDRQRIRCSDSRLRKRITKRPAAPNCAQELTVLTCMID